MNPILINVSGVAVVGYVIQRTASDIDIELTHPFGRLQNGRHVAHFARGKADYLGPLGDRTASALLLETYEATRRTQAHLEELRKRWLARRFQLDALPCRFRTVSDLRQYRVAIRKLLRAGAMEARDYQRGLTMAQGEHDDWRAAREDVLDEVWRDFHGTIPTALRWQLMQMVDPEFTSMEDA